MKHAKTSALLILPQLTLLAASLQAADVSPVWVEYAPAPATVAPVAPVVAQAPGSTPAATPAAAPVAASPSAGDNVAAPAASAPAAEKAVPSAAAADTNGLDSKPANGMFVESEVTPRLFVFDYFDGVDDTLPHYLERYDYRDGLAGDRRSGVDADLDLRLNISNGERDVFTLEREGFGQHNHRGKARFDDDEITFSGAYSHYRSATGGIDYLFSPAVVAGAGVAPFPGGVGTIYPPGNLPFTDNTGTTEYRIDRTTYSAGFKMKPALFGSPVSLAVDYSGYKRDGNQLATSIVMAGGGPPATVDSWRGINLAVDERMNRLGFTLSASPRGLFSAAYEVSLEKFTNQAPDLIRNDFLGTTGDSRQDLSPFYFVPDTSLVTHGLRLSRQYGERTVLAAGYSHAQLQQDNFPERFTTPHGGQVDPYDNGEINSQSAYLTGLTHLSATLGLEGHIKYHKRENDSSFPVGHVISNDEGNNPRMRGPRINSIESMDYGLSATWRPGLLRSTVTSGWQRIDMSRDLSYRLAGEGIPPERILYREDSLSDEVYVKWMAHPATGVTLRLNPSYLWSDKVGLVTEPETAVKLKTMLSYASPGGWMASGYYDYKHRQNGDLSYVGTGGSTVSQDVDNTFHSAGLSLNAMPRESLSTSLTLFWAQNDFESYFFSSDNARFANSPSLTFLSSGLSNYKVNTYGITLGADWQRSEKLKLSGNYTFSSNKGDTASGEALAALEAATGGVDARIDNTLHSISLAADYSLTPTTTLRVNYLYDYYDDNAYDLLTGGVNVLAIGVSFTM